MVPPLMGAGLLGLVEGRHRSLCEVSADDLRLELDHDSPRVRSRCVHYYGHRREAMILAGMNASGADGVGLLNASRLLP